MILWPDRLLFAQLIDLATEIHESSYKKEDSIYGYYTLGVMSSAKAACVLAGVHEDFAYNVLFSLLFNSWNDMLTYAESILSEELPCRKDT